MIVIAVPRNSIARRLDLQKEFKVYRKHLSNESVSYLRRSEGYEFCGLDERRVSVLDSNKSSILEAKIMACCSEATDKYAK